MKRKPKSSNPASRLDLKAARPSTVSSPAKPPLSPGRKWIFRGAALSLPFLALALLEIGLRLAGYGYETAFFREQQDATGKKFLINNDRFTLRFFPPELARWPGTLKLPAEKPAAVCRIFILGESAAMGDPQPSFAASRYLEILLREKFPNQKFEIVNLGITAINSHVIRPIAEDCAARGSADIWIVYMGNNEMVGPFGAATVFGSRAPPLSAVRFNLALQQARVGQLAVSALRHLGGKSKNTSWGGMQMFLQNQVPPHDPRRETVYQNFADNLRAIVTAGLGSDAHVILNTMSVNLKDCPPFASQTNSNLPAADQERFRGLLSEGLSLAARSNHTAAVQSFAAAAKIDPLGAELQFRWAESLAALTLPTAREHYQLACDADALPFRSDTRINAVIRACATNLASPRLILCDTENSLAAAATTGIAGNESFYEHVHFTFDGNYRLGKIWAEQVAALLPDSVRRNAPTNWVNQDVCERAIGLSDWNRMFVLTSVVGRMNQPPLSAQFNNTARVEKIQAELKRLRERQVEPGAQNRARAEFDAAVQQAPADVFLRESYANFLEAIGDQKSALAEYRKITELLPHDFYGCLQTGRMLGAAGQTTEARNFLKRAANHRPSLPDPWYELGVVVATESRFTEALGYFERAVQLRPQDGQYLAYKAKTLSKLNRRDEAIEIYREAIKSKRGGWEAHFELAGELAAKGEVTEAIQEYSEVVRLNPRHAVSRVNLGVMLVRQRRLPEAIQQFEAALQLDPHYPEARDYLDQVRAQMVK